MSDLIDSKRRAILAYLQNRPGVLNKVSMLIRRKMYNVETITACSTRRPGISKMTLTLWEESDQRMRQVVKQIEKMTEVISAKELDSDNSFWREVSIIKFETDPESLKELKQKFNYEILDHQGEDMVIVQVAGTSQLINDFIRHVGDDKIIEVARSGFTALEK